MSATPNMNLTLPSPQVTPGPTYAQTNNTAFETIDEHDHSTGRGVAISPAGMNINATIEMNENDLSEVNSVLLVDRSADIALTRGLYVKNGEFFYKDASGNAVQLTSGGSIAGTTGSFTGLSSPAAATYSSSNKRFTWTYDSSKFARMAQADLDLYPYDASTAYTKAITLKAPTGLEATASYSLTLPTALPAAAELMTVDNAGLIDHASISGTSNQIAVSSSATAVTLSLPSTIATSIVQGGSGAVGAPSLSFSTDPDTGFYRSATGAVGFASDGVVKAGFTTAGLFSVLGSVTAPSYAFNGDSNTGVYSPAADQVAITAGGTQRGLFSSSGLAVTGAVSSTTTGAIGTTLTVGTSVNIGSGGAFKVKVFSGSLTSGASATLTVSGDVLGACGKTATISDFSVSKPMATLRSTDVTSTSYTIYFEVGFSADTGEVRIVNANTATSYYRVIVFYQ